MLPTQRNPLLATDVYKMGHMEQYAPGTDKVYSYLMARSDKTYKETVFFGLAYYLKNYLEKPITKEMAEEFLEARDTILGDADSASAKRCREKITALADLGYWPLHIKAVDEGFPVPVRNVLMTITNTDRRFPWCVGFVESLLLKIWDACSTATCSNAYYRIARRFLEETDPTSRGLLPYLVHDFGYRGCSSEEQAALTGAAHLLYFAGSDTVPALAFTKNYPKNACSLPFYTPASVPASEHSVMCSFGKEDELAAFRHMLQLYPKGIVSIVSDTYDVYEVLTKFAEHLKPEILSRDGKVVFRPDSGNPEHIICGNPAAEPTSPEGLGAIRLLDRAFGCSVNAQGYRVLNPKVGLIYGDGMYLERYERTLARLKELGYASSNLVIGVGGILRNHTRDTLGFALKATYVERDGLPVEIEKTPVTDPGKRSHKGLLKLRLGHKGEFITEDRCSWEQERRSLLKTVYLDGKCQYSESV